MKKPTHISHHFWFCSQPFYEASLTVFGLSDEPSSDLQTPAAAQSVDSLVWIKLFDADGAMVNEISVSLREHPLYLELDPLLDGCKFESGLRHGRLEVVSPVGVSAMLRFANRAGATVSGPAVKIQGDSAQFSPVTLGRDRTSLIALVNPYEVPSTIRVRLILPRRNPDTLIVVPPYGARLLNIEREFAEVLTSTLGNNKDNKDAPMQEARAYVRVSLKNEAPALMQLIEVVERGEQGVQLCTLT